MKSVIIAAVLATASFGAIASNTAVMHFGANNPEFCKLDVLKNDVPLIFKESDLVGDSWAEAEIATNVTGKVRVDLNGSWSQTDAYGGETPDVIQHVSLAKTGSGETVHGDSGSVEFNITSGKSEVLELAVQAPEMTHAGDARYDVTVQISCN